MGYDPRGVLTPRGVIAGEGEPALVRIHCKLAFFARSVGVIAFAAGLFLVLVKSCVQCRVAWRRLLQIVGRGVSGRCFSAS